MSSSFRLTPRAVADLDAIADYTIETWGPAQLETYLMGFNKQGKMLERFERFSGERDDVHPGYRSYPEESHVIFYIINDERVDVIGIPHKSMDVSAFFT